MQRGALLLANPLPVVRLQRLAPLEEQKARLGCAVAKASHTLLFFLARARFFLSFPSFLLDERSFQSVVSLGSLWQPDPSFLLLPVQWWAEATGLSFFKNPATEVSTVACGREGPMPRSLLRSPASGRTRPYEDQSALIGRSGEPLYLWLRKAIGTQPEGMSRSTRLRKTRLLVNSPQTVVYDALLWL